MHSLYDRIDLWLYGFLILPLLVALLLIRNMKALGLIASGANAMVRRMKEQKKERNRVEDS